MWTLWNFIELVKLSSFINICSSKIFPWIAATLLEHCLLRFLSHLEDAQSLTWGPLPTVARSGLGTGNKSPKGSCDFAPCPPLPACKALARSRPSFPFSSLLQMSRPEASRMSWLRGLFSLEAGLELSLVPWRKRFKNQRRSLSLFSKVLSSIWVTILPFFCAEDSCYWFSWN